ncbi:hypothetical protein ABK040_002905 [Willaertia magna]
MLKSKVIASTGVKIVPFSKKLMKKVSSSSLFVPIQQKTSIQKRNNNIRFTTPGPKSLDQIIKVPLLERETPEVIRKIWTEHYYMNPTIISDIVPYIKYQVLLHRAKECPMFVLPVFKNIGFQTMVLQLQKDHVLFTGMREFKAKGEYAQPYLSVSHFTEFSQSKGIVLMRGEINDQSVFNKGDAKELINFMYKFYLEDNLYHSFVEVFNKEPFRFNFEELINSIKAIKPPKPRDNPLVAPPKKK